MPDPATREEYDARVLAHSGPFGFGIEETGMRYGCPFCGAPNWHEYKLIDSIHDESVVTQEKTCAECGRSGRFLIEHPGPGQTTMELVQTGGDDPPAYLDPAPRRV